MARARAAVVVDTRTQPTASLPHLTLPWGAPVALSSCKARPAIPPSMGSPPRPASQSSRPRRGARTSRSPSRRAPETGNSSAGAQRRVHRGRHHGRRGDRRTEPVRSGGRVERGRHTAGGQRADPSSEQHPPPFTARGGARVAKSSMMRGQRRRLGCGNSRRAACPGGCRRSFAWMSKMPRCNCAAPGFPRFLLYGAFQALPRDGCPQVACLDGQRASHQFHPV